MKPCSTRILTTIGGITVLKTLKNSKLNYPFLSLPEPDEHTFNVLNTLQIYLAKYS